MPDTAVATQPSNVEIYKASTDAASICKEIVVKTALNIQKRKYVRVEGWQAIATAHGCVASSRNVEMVYAGDVLVGIGAIGEVRRMSDGALLSQAEGFVGMDEPTWFGGEQEYYDRDGQRRTRRLQKRADYAIRAMAQTRAISRACRSAFAYVVVMMDAGLQTTPAEEIGGEPEETEGEAPTPPPSDHAKNPPPPKKPTGPLTEHAKQVVETKQNTPDPNRVRIDQFVQGFKTQCEAATTQEAADAILKDQGVMQGADWLNRHAKADWDEFCRIRDEMISRVFA